MPQISVIVPVYNVELYLDRCIQSLVNQSFSDLEIILVDDKSTDNSGRMCDQYAKLDSRIRVIHRDTNGGLGHTRNSGLELASGKYVSFLDSDDYVDLCLYEKVYKECEDNNLEICFYRCRRVNSYGNVYLSNYNPNEHLIKTKEGSLELLLLMLGEDPYSTDIERISDMSVSVCMALYRLDVIRNNNVVFESEREMASEDLIFHLNLIPKIERIKVLPNVYYNYFVNTNSISTNYDDIKLLRFIKLLEYLKKELPIIYPDGKYLNSFTGYILRTFKVIIRFESWRNSTIRDRCRRIRKICGMEICQYLYTLPVVKMYKLQDRVIIFCMKYRLSLLLIFIYKFLYRKYGVKRTIEK